MFKNDETCPFCSHVDYVLSALDDTRSRTERFSLLHAVMSDMYNNGYVKALRINAESLLEIADTVEGMEMCPNLD